MSQPAPEALGSPSPTGLQRALAAFLTSPGVEYACVIAVDTGKPADGVRLLAELGTGTGGVDGSQVIWRWAVEVRAAVALEPDDTVEDMTITSRRSFHVARWVTQPAHPDSPLLVYLRLNRARGNLAVARRELAASNIGAWSEDAVAGPGNKLIDSSTGSAARPAGSVRPVLMNALPRRVPGGAATDHPVTSVGRASLDPMWDPMRDESASAVVQAPPVFSQNWTDDLHTLRRLLVGLRTLA